MPVGLARLLDLSPMIGRGPSATLGFGHGAVQAWHSALRSGEAQARRFGSRSGEVQVLRLGSRPGEVQVLRSICCVQVWRSRVIFGVRSRYPSKLQRVSSRGMGARAPMLELTLAIRAFMKLRSSPMPNLYMCFASPSRGCRDMGWCSRLSQSLEVLQINSGGHNRPLLCPPQVLALR